VKLKEIIKIASDAYGCDGVLQRYYDDYSTDHGDGLAKFLVAEITDTYDETATDKEQLKEAYRVMETAKTEVIRVCEGLFRGMAKVLDEVVQIVVGFHLTASTRQEYYEERTFPVGVTDGELDAVAQQLKGSVDGEKYTDDNEYWEEQVPRWEKTKVITDKCHCLVKHANTPEEREVVRNRLDYCVSIDDADGVRMSQQQLDNENCPAKPKG